MCGVSSVKRGGVCPLQAAVSEGELQFLFVMTVAYDNPDKLRDFHFWGIKTYVMRWIQLLWKYGLVKDFT